MLLPSSDVSIPAPRDFPLVNLVSSRKRLDRAIADKRLALQVVEDLPTFYSRMRDIALSGSDKDASVAITYLLDRLLGKIPSAVSDIQNNILIQNNQQTIISPDDLRERIARLKMVSVDKSITPSTP